MSQSATLYRISTETFRKLEVSAGKPEFEISDAKNYTIFHGSFLGLEYILSKGQEIPTIEIINNIFSPTQTLGGQEIENLSIDEIMEYYETGSFISYLDTTIISKINNFLDTLSEVYIQSQYDAEELNKNGIYPEVWHNDNSPDKAFNSRHILTDFTLLKNIIKQAKTENDYMLVFVG